MNLPWTIARDLRRAVHRQRKHLLIERAAAARAAALPNKDWTAWLADLERP
jgi:hypothetical protein